MVQLKVIDLADDIIQSQYPHYLKGGRLSVGRVEVLLEEDMEQYVMTTGTIRMSLLSVYNSDSLLMVKLVAKNVYHQLYSRIKLIFSLHSV